MTSVTYSPDEFEYGLSRVKNTVILRKDGEPYYIRDGHCGKLRLHGFPMKDGHNGQSVDLGVGFEDFSLEPVRLGYINDKQRRDATYVTRTAARHYKQGLNATNIRGIKFPVKLLSFGLYRAIIGKYPSKSFALEQVICGEVRASAFCRDFAFRRDKRLSEGTVVLAYRDRPVGTAKYNEEAGLVTYQLNESYTFLKEALEESWNNVH